ncbi:parallel beta-helix repeat (two copies) [Butyrivibrio sp. ob235]|uniref:right-handed parallel beta-helix repeat-containing protein n=1 Tax=Butyrivibrio sp. ob235 TaxID=1761780 RepID=UPI0008BBC055|nr:right-handed parallel beta-helix repeat-containing protein [Butyrivibrio sp. ob235]SEL81571.1 parallel beta-helix repeat (two copies) [Butyrivibrio sp. ob235]
MKKISAIILPMMLAAFMLIGSPAIISKADGTSYPVTDGEELRLLSYNIAQGVSAPGTITLQNDITVTKNIWLASDVTLDLNGHTLTGNTNGSILFTDATYGENKGGFEKYKNITIKNGNIKKADSVATGMVIIGHATNVVVDHVNFSGAVDCHMLELGACKKATITNCTFKDGKYSTAEDKGAYEALSLDIASEGNFSVKPFDDTACEDVAVSACIFEGVPRAFGAHRIQAGHFFNNISVKGCTFKNILGTAIETIGWTNSIVDGNTLDGVGFGVDCRPSDKQVGGNPGSYDANITISNNTITLKTSKGKTPCGIRISGILNSKTLLGGYKVTDNKVLGPHAYAVYAGYVKNSTISGTTTEGASINGIRVEYCDGVTVSGNTISKTKGTKSPHGIALISNNNDLVKENTITNPGAVGIFIQGSQNGQIIGNTIKKAKTYGITVCKNAVVSLIAENTIVKPKKNGIDVQGKKSQILTTRGNKITKPGNRPYGGNGKYLAADEGILTLKKGKSSTISTYGQKGKTKYSTEDKSIATVDSKGKIVTKGKGTTTVTAKKGKYSAQVTITVK